MKKPLLMIAAIQLAVYTGFGMIIPILPKIIKSIGAPPVHLGLLLSVYSIVSFITAPIWGSYSDRVGRRPVIIWGLLGFSISFFLFAISGGQLWLMYLSRILGGLSAGALSACAMAYVADITGEEERAKSMGIVGMMIGIGFILGPAIGGLFNFWGPYVPFYAAAVLTLIMMFVAAGTLKESLQNLGETHNIHGKPSRLKAFTGSTKYLYVLSFSVAFALAGLESTFQFFEMEKIGATVFEIGIMFAVVGVVEAIMQGGVIRLFTKQGGETKGIAIGLVASSAGFFLILLSENIGTAMLYLAIFSAGNALIRPCVLSLLTKKTSVGQGMTTGLNSSMGSLGRIVGPILGTSVFAFNIHLPFLIGGFLSLAEILLLVQFLRLDHRKKTNGNLINKGQAQG
ncbi:multidrug resistance protein [Scopulibacillus darangshiensis]|uniref:Multidrug resistance protein n=1 Tax=Scopulibacillus darangshiensis TaxID=442528 RepID=A0A4R2P7M9_9BACL|nr:MFS transporter [Scopulibacillus darangshiensis]TCP30902.1 multidrug resistance protein [Scopulibacillus darangshiensis]